MRPAHRPTKAAILASDKTGRGASPLGQAGKLISCPDLQSIEWKKIVLIF
jgi:hypothetical protein